MNPCIKCGTTSADWFEAVRVVAGKCLGHSYPLCAKCSELLADKVHERIELWRKEREKKTPGVC